MISTNDIRTFNNLLRGKDIFQAEQNKHNPVKEEKGKGEKTCTADPKIGKVKQNGKINTAELSSKCFFPQNYCGGGGGVVNESKVLEPQLIHAIKVSR